MVNKLVITVTDINGSKSYSFDKIVKKIVFFTILIVIILIVGSFYWINYLTKELNNIKIEKEKQIKNLTKIKNQLSTQNKLLNLQIKDKIKDLQALDQKLEEIEQIIGLNENNITNPIKRANIAKLTSSYKAYLLRTIPNGSPLRETKVTARFGWRIHPISKKRQFHRGIDLRAKRNTPVFATADGVVRYVWKYNRGAFGKVVIVAHNFGFETVYGHLEKVKVKLGQVIKKGNIIAFSGNSGRSTGPHLHYEVRYGSKVLNPKYFLKWDMKNFNVIFNKVRRVEWDSLLKMIQTQKKLIIQ